uniref:ATP synthase complex subunit 8 n=1 Tax=Chrysotimus molliculus TaxID=1000613 RepID=A0A7G7CDD3_9MUSC|nr:ATP synthase F0 subunit 8 [Chrysotimus molliculus]
MPQMAPISWLSLYVIFSMTLIMFCIMNYYSYLPSMSKTNENSMKDSFKSMNWKW